MISEKRLAANRDNARKSTGPRTSEGKARSSRNRTKHGFYAAEIRLPEYWEARALDYAARAAEDYRADPVVAALVAHRVQLSVHNSYVVFLQTRFNEAMFAAPDPRGYRIAHAAELCAIHRYHGRIRRQIRASQRLVIPAVVEFEAAQSQRPKTHTAAASSGPATSHFNPPSRESAAPASALTTPAFTPVSSGCRAGPSPFPIPPAVMPGPRGQQCPAVPSPLVPPVVRPGPRGQPVTKQNYVHSNPLAIARTPRAKASRSVTLPASAPASPVSPTLAQTISIPPVVRPAPRGQPVTKRNYVHSNPPATSPTPPAGLTALASQSFTPRPCGDCAGLLSVPIPPAFMPAPRGQPVTSQIYVHSNPSPLPMEFYSSPTAIAPSHLHPNQLPAHTPLPPPQFLRPRPPPHNQLETKLHRTTKQPSTSRRPVGICNRISGSDIIVTQWRPVLH